MKFNWGHGIFIFLTIFVILAIAFIVFSLNQDIDLVSKDYYNKGASFSEQIEINRRSENYIDSINIVINQTNVSVLLSSSLQNSNDTITAYFYRPSDKNSDFSLTSIMTEKIEIPTNKLKKGRYIIKFSWKHDNETYNIEKETRIE
jgi:hypothetical protein